MTNTPNPGQEPDSNSGTRRLALIRAGFIVGGVVLVGVAAGGWWTWQFINDRLAPLVAENLSKTFNRPVEVGAVESISLNSITFGQSSIPATSTDPDRMTINSVKANFNLLEVLWDRTLSLNVTLVSPDAYIEQNQEGLWISTEIEQDDEEKGPLSIEVDTLRVQNGTLTLKPSGNVEQSEVVEPEAPETPDTDESRTEPETLPDQLGGDTLVVVQNLNGTATFRNDNKLISYDVGGKLDSGGTVQIEGRTNIELPETALTVEGRDLLAADVNRLVPLPLNLQAGRVSANIEALFPPNDQPLSFDGTVRFKDIVASLEGLPQPFNKVNGALRLQGQNVTFQDVRGQYGAIPARVSGSLNTQEGYNLLIQAPSVTTDQLLTTFNVDKETLPIELAGTFRSELRLTGEIENPIISGIAQNTRPVQVDQVDFKTAQTRFTINRQALTFNEIRLNPTAGGFITGKGIVGLEEDAGLVFDLTAQNLPGDALARSYEANLSNITLGEIDATAQVFGSFNNIQTLVQWQAPQATYPGRGKVAINSDAIRFQDTVLLVEGGIVRGSGVAQQGRWQASVQGSGIELSRFSPELRGLFSGDFQLAGSLSDFSPAAIEAEGEARFSEGIALINEPLTASVRWLGDRLQIRQATAPGFQGDGFIFARLQGEGAPEITNLDLNVALQNYPVTDLPIPIPQQVQVAGTTDFTGRVTGSLDAINVAGRVGINGLAANSLAFEPLQGNFQYAANRGLNLDVSGTQDRIALQLDAQNRPVSFFVQQGETIAQGRGRGDRLIASLQNFPIAALNIAPAAEAGLGRVTGRLDGNFDINIADLQNPAVIGEVAITNPAIDYISADLFTGKFRYVDGAFVLTDGELRQAGSRYLLTANYTPGADPLFQGKIVADPGRVEDLLTAFQFFETADFSRGFTPPNYADANAVETLAVGMPNATVLNQLRRFSEIDALLRQQITQREGQSFIPDLSKLKGAFAGEVNLAFSPQTGVAANFNLSGQDWRWDQYEVNQVIAQGSFQNGILTLLPVRLESDDSLLTFSGQLGGEQQSGQLRAENIPVAALRDLFRLPIDVTGNLNANATLTGSVGNPQVVGELFLDDVVANQTETVPPIRTLFGYNDARLQFDTRFVEATQTASTEAGDRPIPNPDPTPDLADRPSQPLTEDDTFQFTGSIPYALPFVTARPDSTELSIDLNIRNEGLSLINLFTDQVAWEDGQAAVQLQVRGNLQPTPEQPGLTALTAIGSATFDNAQISAKALPEDLTNVTGTVLFNTDRIEVQTLQGQFSDGQVTAQGTLPILTPLPPNDPDAASPLTVSLSNVDLNLENLYQGGVNGQVLVAGTALAPQIGGEILLSNGRILIPGEEEAEVPGTTTTATAPESRFGGNGSSFVTPPEFNNLRLTLGDRLRVTRDPVLSFVVNGDLLVNGTQDIPRLDGTVNLQSGYLNLFTTQFNLDRDYTNTAIFTANRGLDPILDTRLVTSVPEITRYPSRTTSPFPTSEIVDTPSQQDFGAIQTVRVQATVSGPASQIFNNLELTSSPSRTETEILALLGGGFVGNLEQGDPTAAIASLAGTTVLSNLQNFINNTLGITNLDFRLFPASLVGKDEESRSTLGLAAELGVNATDDLSISVLQILTGRQSTQLSVRYRLTDELSVRGSTNFDESQAVLEFETRF